MSAICLAPAASCAIFPGFILSLLRRCDSVSAASAAAMSLRFSAKMASSLASRATAMEYSSAARSSLLRFCRVNGIWGERGRGQRVGIGDGVGTSHIIRGRGKGLGRRDDGGRAARGSRGAHLELAAGVAGRHGLVAG